MLGLVGRPSLAEGGNDRVELGPVAFVQAFSVSEWRLCFGDFGDKKRPLAWASGQEQEPEGIRSYSEPNGSCPSGDYVQDYMALRTCMYVCMYVPTYEASLIVSLHWTRIRRRIHANRYTKKICTRFVEREKKIVVVLL